MMESLPTDMVIVKKIVRAEPFRPEGGYVFLRFLEACPPRERTDVDHQSILADLVRHGFSIEVRRGGV